MVKDARVDVILQRIEEDVGNEIDVEPKHVRRYGVNNIFQRVFSYLLGWDIYGKPTKLLCTTAGVLKTAPAGAGLEVYERNPTSDDADMVSIGDVDVETETFSAVVSSVDLMSSVNDIYAELSKDGVTYGKKILLRGSVNQTYSIDAVTKSVKFSNVDTTGANDGSYYLVGWR